MRYEFAIASQIAFGLIAVVGISMLNVPAALIAFGIAGVAIIERNF